MTLPSSNNPISLGQIQTEFGGSNPIALAGEYYRNGSYTTSNNTNVPTSGTISLSNFYGSRRAIYGCTDPNATNYNRNATDDDGTCSYPSSGGGGGDSCTEESGSSYYGVGFKGYVKYTNSKRVDYTFITSTDTLLTGSIPGTEVSYSFVGKFIIDHYTKNFSRYPDSGGFDYWFTSYKSHKSLATLADQMNASYNDPAGEKKFRSDNGGLDGVYNNCNVLKTIPS
jgi:hypothetical protein